jgi:hypothetical protein
LAASWKGEESPCKANGGWFGPGFGPLPTMAWRIGIDADHIRFSGPMTTVRVSKGPGLFRRCTNFYKLLIFNLIF